LDVGASVNLAASDERTTFTPFTKLQDEQRAVYVYADRKLGDSLSLTLGVNIDERSGRGFDGRELNGKAAIVWEQNESTTWRLAYGESPAPPVASTTRTNGQPDLERTRLAGFGQLVYPNVDRTRTRWGAIDHWFSENVFGGIALRERSLLRPFLVNGVEPNWVDIDERVANAHLYWLPSSRLSLAASYETDAYAAQPGLSDFTEFETDRLTLDVNYFVGPRLTASFRAAGVRQHGNFITRPGARYAPGKSVFAVFDAGLSYRLPNLRGILDLRIDNLFVERFSYHEPEYDQLSYVRARTAFLNFTVRLP
jgi:hypothetical protein